MEKVKNYEAGSFDVIVVGGGHAGCEAALASARMGQKTLMLVLNLDSIAAMSCNPNVGGTGKGHLVREIDALGGQMAKVIDETYIQSRMLNTSKGPAVHSLRAQADKRAYHDEMKRVVERQENLIVKENEATKIIVEDSQVKGVLTHTGAIYRTKAVVIATGTYLHGRIHIGELNYASGPQGFKPANELTSSLIENGLEILRLKTGTPARVNRRSIDFSNMQVQKGDSKVVPFSFENFGKDFSKKQEDCYLTYTTERCHEIIRENIGRSALSLGNIEGVGPRYCPSIEDKVTRFSDKPSHQVFIEPEGLTTDEMYIQGVSSSLPEDVQNEFYKEIIGLENCEIMRPAYAIEYDAINAMALKRSLENKKISGMFFAGQINGSSGYEEAAAQGIIAGINAARKVQGKDALILDRSEAYIGVLIDDIVTKGTREPYRMMTARAEYRLTLRQDNADLRLTQKGYEIGLIGEERYQRFIERKNAIESEMERIENIKINPTEENNKKVVELGSTPLVNTLTLKELLRRPELNYEMLEIFDPQRPELRDDIKEEVEIETKYEGYIQKQYQQIEQFKKLENKKLDSNFDYKEVKGLRLEAVEKLNRIKPESIGQASRITGVSPADINVLLIHLELRRRNAQTKND